MIDLSFLTEEEQETISAVLKRDAELKKAEVQRVRKLQKTVRDRCQLRYMSGEWFYETKQLRHEDRIHGADIIRASMKHTQKPLTILELSQIFPERSSFVCSKNKEVFVPPVLCGLLQEPRDRPSKETTKKRNSDRTPQDAPKPLLQSPTKQRRNPFNSEVSFEEKDPNTPTQTTSEVDWPDGQIMRTGRFKRPSLSALSPDRCISFASNFKQEPNVGSDANNASVLKPMLKNRAFSASYPLCSAEVEGPEGRQNNSAASPGISKHLSASSSTDSLSSQLDLQSAVSLDSANQTWIDGKQEEFGFMAGGSRLERQDGKEVGEQGMLDIDSVTPFEVESDGIIEKTVSTTQATCGPLLSPLDSQKDEPNNKNEAYFQEENAKVLPDDSEHCGLEIQSPAEAGLSASGKPVPLEAESEEDFQSKATEQPTGNNVHQLPDQSTDISFDITSDIRSSTDASSKGSSQAISPKPKKRLLRLFQREKDKFTEMKFPEGEEAKISMQKEPNNNLDLSDYAADPTRNKPADVNQEAEPSETMQVIPCIDPQTKSDVKNKSNDSLQMEATASADVSKEKTSLTMIKSNLLIYLPEEEGTYRASPVIIYDETDDFLTCSITEPQERISPVPPSVASSTPKQEGRKPGELPQVISPSLQEGRAAKIRELKNFWEKGPTESRITATKVKDTSSTSMPLPQSALDSKGNYEPEMQTSPHKPKPSVDSKSLKVTVKGFISQGPDKSQLRSSGFTEVVQSTSPQFKANTEPLLRPLSPTKSHSPRSKDQDDEVRRSPSKTCHPRVLPREPSSPKTSRLEGSPLITFPINIDPKVKSTEEHHGRLTPVLRKKMSPSGEAEQTVPTETTSSKELLSHCPPLEPEDSAASFDHLNSSDSSASPQTKKASEKAAFACLARSYIPEDYQHYLGPHEKAHVPAFHQDTPAAAESDLAHRPQNVIRDSVGNQFDNPTEENPPRVKSLTEQNKSGNSSQYTTTRARSLPQANPSKGYNETSDPFHSPLKSSRSMTSSESLEKLTSKTREEREQDESGENMNQSVEDVSSPPSAFTLSTLPPVSSPPSAFTLSTLPPVSSPPSAFTLSTLPPVSSPPPAFTLSTLPPVSSPPPAFTLSNLTEMRSGVSVPDLHPNEADVDDVFESSLVLRRNTGSSMSNISLSSGMASMSSISGSLSSIYPGDFGDIEVQGNIQFAVNYIQKLSEFHIFVVHCKDLAVADIKKNRSDPYVKCYLLPDKVKLGKRKTSVKKKTLNPNYNEILRFKVMMEVLKTQSLNVSVWHNDTFGRNSFLGEAEVDLSEWDFGNTRINEYSLKPRVSPPTPTSSPSHLMDGRGQMKVALRFLAQTSYSERTSRMETGEVQIWVKDCKNLPSVRGVIIDPFVKCTVLPDTSRKSRQKTRVVKRTANPMFNHTMVYDGFRPEDLREACAEITVWDHDRLHNHYLGGLRLGLGTGKSYGAEVLWMDSTRDEANLWRRMLHSDGEWVEDVLPLRMLMMAKSMPK